MSWLGDIASSLFGGWFQNREAKKQRAWNAEQAELNRQFQSDEAAINREFQSSEAALQRSWSAAQAERAMDWNEEMYAKYNSLSGKIAQANEAGVNPMVAITGNAVSPMSTGASAPSGATAGSVGTPTGATAISQFVDLVATFMGLRELRSQIDVNKSIAEKNRADAGKTGKETEWIDRLNQASVNMSDAEIQRTLKDIEVKDNAILVGNAEIEVMASEVALNEIAGALKNMEIQQIREMLPYIKQLHEAQTESERADAAYKLASATLAEKQSSRTDTGETLDVVNTVIDGVGDTVTTGVLIADMIGEIFGVEDAGQRWQETKSYERDKKGRVISETRSGTGKSKKVSSKRRKR